MCTVLYSCGKNYMSLTQYVEDICPKISDIESGVGWYIYQQVFFYLAWLPFPSLLKEMDR
jgi:hypothetical protein